MEIEEKHNPNYHERLRPKSWSDLPQDLLISVFERLSFANFQRAKSVCSSWYSASRQSVPNNQIPWLILFPENNDNDNYKNSSCTLFNPEEKHKLYKTKDLGVEFAKSVCLATCGSWLLMRDRQIYPMYIFYIVNLFTHERINLPPVDLLWKDYELHNASQKREILRGTRVRSPVFWIEEKTKDYVVIWGFNHWCVVYSKKGDTLWNQIPQTSACFDMVYKDHKLYFLSYALCGHFKIFDFSGEIPLQTFRGYVRVEEVRFDRGVYRQPCAQQLVVTLTGIVLKVDRWIRKDKTWYFQIFKVYPSESIEKPEQIQKKPEQIHSLGDESILLDQGITVLANDTHGFIRNSIYFTVGYGQNKYDMLIFNLETQETMEPPLHTLIDSSSFQFSKAQWFLPSFTHT